MPFRHWFSGFKRMVVSTMEKGAGSSEVSARPRLTEYPLHFREGFDDPVLGLENSRRLGDRDSRQGGGHIKQGTFP